MAKLYKVDGTVEIVKPKDGRTGFTCKELYALIGDGCEMIESVNYRKGYYFICDEEFRLREGWQEKRNKKVNDMIIRETGYNWDLAGNVVICSEREFK